MNADTKDKFNTSRESGVTNLCPKILRAKLEMKIYKLIFEHKTPLPIHHKHKLTSYQSILPHLYGTPKIYIADIPLRYTVISSG
jgi:hypothetical protein